MLNDETIYDLKAIFINVNPFEILYYIFEIYTLKYIVLDNFRENMESMIPSVLGNMFEI